LGGGVDFAAMGATGALGDGVCFGVRIGDVDEQDWGEGAERGGFRVRLRTLVGIERQCKDKCENINTEDAENDWRARRKRDPLESSNSYAGSLMRGC